MHNLMLLCHRAFRRAYLFPRLARWGRLELEDVISETTNEIGWGALLCFEKVHGVTMRDRWMVRTMARGAKVGRKRERLWG